MTEIKGREGKQMKKKVVFTMDDAISGVLHGNNGTFRVVLDEETCGTTDFALLVNTMTAGVTGSPHKHDDSEHAWYVLSGKGTYILDGEEYRFGPGMVLYAPRNTMHSINVDPEEDATFVIVYSPPGPEQLLKTKGANAFS